MTESNWRTRWPRRSPGISRADFERTLKIYKDCIAMGYQPAGCGIGKQSAITPTAKALNLSPQTVRERLAWGPYFGTEVPGIEPYPGAFEGMPQKGKGEYRAPDLPSMDADLTEEMARQVQEFERRREAEMAQRWMRFEVEGDEPFALVFVGDPHLDDPHTDLGRLMRDMAIVEATPRMWAIGLGDYVNGWIGKLHRKYADQAVTERGAYLRAKWLFSLPIWWMLIKGNHDAWKGGGNPLDWMLDSEATPVLEWEAQFVAECGGREWSFWAAHDFPGSSAWNILHGPLKRAMMTGAIADMFICGDHHCYGVLHTQHEHTGRSYWLARARGYKMQDPYSRQCGFGEMNIGHSIVAICNPKTGGMQCFDNVEDGALYLDFLRGRK